MSGVRPLATLLLSAWLALSALPTLADTRLQTWREEARRVRQLVENNVPRAYEEALRLQSSLPADAQPSDQVRAFNVLARAETYYTRIVDADRHAQQARALALEHGDKIGQAEANLTIALNSVSEGRIDKVRQAAVEALTLLDGTDRPELLAEAMLRTASMYLRHNQTSVALVMSMQTLELAEHSSHPRALALAHHAMALSHNASNQHAPAQTHYQQMLKYARTANSALLEGLALHGLADTTSALGDPKTAETMQRQAIEHMRQVGSPSNLGHAYYGLSTFLRQQGRIAEAVAIMDLIEAIYRQPLNRIGLWWILNTRAGDLLTLGRIDAAAADAEAAYALAEAVNFPLYLAESGKRLAAIAAARKQHQQAYAYRIEADGMAKKAEQEKLSELIVDMTSRYQSEARQRQIEALTRREAEQSRQMRQLWTVFAATLFMLTLVGYFAIRLRHSRTEIQALNTNLERRVQERTNELRQQSQYLRTLVDTLPLSVWLKDERGCYLAASATNDTIKGKMIEEIVGRTDLEIWSGTIGAAHRSSDLETIQAGQATNREFSWTDPDSSRTVWVEVDKAPVIDEDGTLLGIVGVARDISARKAVEEAREAALAEATRLAEARSTFLAQMSHELRTPLNSILGYTQTLLARPGLDTRQRADLDIIWSSGEHLLMLIGDILDFAKIDAGKMLLSPGNIHLGRFLNAIADLVQMRAKQQGLEFTRNFSEALPAGIYADELRLRQVLFNLLSNAIKFTQPGGKVSMAVDVTPSGQLCFAVSDNGVGIAAELLNTIFEPFEQTSEARKRLGGTGLGLPISRAIVRQMGGDIKVASRPGAGSRFFFMIDAPHLADDQLQITLNQSSLCSSVTTPSKSTHESPITPPSQEALEALHELALEGNMRDIIEYADHLDERYHAFAERISKLAQQYRSRMILELIEQHLNNSETSS